VIDGLFAVTREAMPDPSDMDHFHRMIAADELAEVSTQLALFDPARTDCRTQRSVVAAYSGLGGNAGRSHAEAPHQA
jgi:hypothetical protein